MRINFFIKSLIAIMILFSFCGCQVTRFGYQVSQSFSNKPVQFNIREYKVKYSLKYWMDHIHLKMTQVSDDIGKHSISFEEKTLKRVIGVLIHSNDLSELESHLVQLDVLLKSTYFSKQVVVLIQFLRYELNAKIEFYKEINLKDQKIAELKTMNSNLNLKIKSIMDIEQKMLSQRN